jgi:hypothetical protein
VLLGIGDVVRLPYRRRKASRCRSPDGLFCFACAIGYAYWTWLIPREAIVAAMPRGCQRNGFLREEGRAACVEIIGNGLDYAEWDGLPDLRE